MKTMTGTIFVVSKELEIKILPGVYGINDIKKSKNENNKGMVIKAQNSI